MTSVAGASNASVPVATRPPVPPVPAGRWSRRLRIDEVPLQEAASSNQSVSSELAPPTGTTITVYDPVMHLRVISCEDELHGDELVAFALEQSPHLSKDATGRVLLHTFDDYPCQVVVNDPLPPQKHVAPIFLHSSQLDVCTIEFSDTASPFELALTILPLCKVPPSLHFQVARRVVEFRINNVRAPPSIAGAAGLPTLWFSVGLFLIGSLGRGPRLSNCRQRTGYCLTALQSPFNQGPPSPPNVHPSCWHIFRPHTDIRQAARGNVGFRLCDTLARSRSSLSINVFQRRGSFRLSFVIFFLQERGHGKAKRSQTRENGKRPQNGLGLQPQPQGRLGPMQKT